MFCPAAQRVNSLVNPPSCSGRPFGHYGGACSFSLAQHSDVVLPLHISVHTNSRRRQRNLHAVSLLSTAEFGSDREPGGQHARDSLRNGSNGVARPKEQAKAMAAHSARAPFDRGDSQSRTHREEGLPVSLFAPYKNLPDDGRTLTEFEETCDPMERNCQVPMHVWESKCRACYGTGSVQSSSRRGKRITSICPSCTGMGYVRRASARLMPNLNGNHMTIGRPRSLDDLEDMEQGRRNGKH